MNLIIGNNLETQEEANMRVVHSILDGAEKGSVVFSQKPEVAIAA